MNNKRTKVQKVLAFLLGGVIMIDYFGVNLDIRSNYGMELNGGMMANITVVKYCALLDDDYVCIKCLDGYTLEKGACESS